MVKTPQAEEVEGAMNFPAGEIQPSVEAGVAVRQSDEFHTEMVPVPVKFAWADCARAVVVRVRRARRVAIVGGLATLLVQ